MADTGDAAKPSGRGRAKKATGDTAPTEPTETTDPTEPTDVTEPGAAGPDGTEPPARRRWSVPFLLFLLVLLAAIAGWGFGVVSYRDKQDAEDELNAVEDDDSTTTTELEDQIAELEGRVDMLENESRPPIGGLDDVRARIDDCVAETRSLVELLQDALADGDIDDEALDAQAGRTQRVCAAILGGLNGSTGDERGDDDGPSSPSSTPPTTTLP